LLNGLRTNQMCLILGFLGLISAVPVGQTALEVCRGERVQFTDLFRYTPTESNLRRFERTLEDRSWFQRASRPRMQRLLFLALRDAGSKAVMGRGNWVFFRPGLRYLIEPDRLDVGPGDSPYVQPATGATRCDSVVRVVVQFRGQLEERGIHLLVVPAPEKASVYPDMLTRRAERSDGRFRSPTLGLLGALHQHGVETVDLFAVFQEARRQQAGPSPGGAYYLARDTHWTPDGAKLAAEAVAQRMRDLGWAPQHRREHLTQRVRVERRGDILEMMQVPGVQDLFPAEVVECEQVLDRTTGLLVPKAGGPEGTYMNAHLVDTPLQSSILVLGDSFCRIYQLPEPQSLGRYEEQTAARQPGGREGGLQRTRRLLPGSAGFPSLLARELGAPVDYIVSDGGAATDVRQKLSINAAILERKTVVVWEFAERDIHLGTEGWKPTALPPEW
jgi:hypothetical protein